MKHLQKKLARGITSATLLVAIIVFKLNRVTLEGDFKPTYSYYDSYSYTFYVAAIGLFYNMVQIPFPTFYLLKAKRLLNHYGFILFDFYSDKVISLLLATAIGASFGATFDLKKINYLDYYSSITCIAKEIVMHNLKFFIFVEEPKI
ncbi:hypothetical protein LIER_36801 [Lithospermum erythrorhizon]|uniref:CASP-like protein n=1 Tax=Lithospermum erythrorhizon TaxID=34254 RepID=A0AAV3PB28_LITER